MDKLLKIIVAELGQKEISGPVNNPTIVNYAKEAGFTWVNDDETPWCSIFANWAAKKAGLKGSGKENARSWLLTGTDVDTAPEPGDVVVFWRVKPDAWEGHVGFYFGFSADGTRVYCLGGNQGNQVSLTALPKDQVLGFRRLKEKANIKLTDKVLKRGDKGDNVKALQDALKIAGFNCGTSDGDFGPKTENAVKQLQTLKTGLKIDGIFEQQTRAFLLEVLNQHGLAS
jgi:uncharacterized protein (TIGR02594 family)